MVLKLNSVTPAVPLSSSSLELPSLRPHVRFRVAVRYTRSRTKVLHGFSGVLRSTKENLLMQNYSGLSLNLNNCEYRALDNKSMKFGTQSLSYRILAKRSSQGKLVEGQALATSLLDPCPCSLGKPQGCNLQSWNFINTNVVGHGSDNDGDFIFLYNVITTWS